MEAEASPSPKAIVLFSDGTGNSSSKLQKTNVWRLYEALDLGDPAKVGDRAQIAYYDDGVGNSSFRLLAILGGVFGFGLARNVRELYKFLCRNYNEGDEIYAFGYSRGSYTIRLLVAMVAQYGVVGCCNGNGKMLSEAELDMRVSDVWREFRLQFHTSKWYSDLVVLFIRYALALVTAGWRRLTNRDFGTGKRRNLDLVKWLREWATYWRERRLRSKKRRQYSLRDWEDAKKQANCPVRFVGVFDTVAAYGGPIVEITRAIDDFFWPLSMPDYRLSPAVQTARHALSIDDKRGSFDPLLWDEVFERANPDFDERNPRMKQVWFAGMHSDVGGGYSDESLSYVPLFWMLEHAEEAGLNFIETMRSRIEHYANPHGFMHDSRRGLGSFYRYQPRYINAWIDTRESRHLVETFKRDTPDSMCGPDDKSCFVKPGTGVFRDQVIDGKRYKYQGFLVAPILLHKDMIRRLRAQSDGYGPVNLIDKYATDDGIRGVRHGVDHEPLNRKALGDLGTTIRIRRFWYFVTMALLTTLVVRAAIRMFPVLSAGEPGQPTADKALCEQGGWSTVAQTVCENATIVLPGTAALLAGALLATPWEFVAFALAIAFTASRGTSLEKKMQSWSRANWHASFKEEKVTAPSHGPLASGLMFLASSAKGSLRLQTMLANLKWFWLPFILGALAWLVILGSIVHWYCPSALPLLVCKIELILGSLGFCELISG